MVLTKVLHDVVLFGSLFLIYHPILPFFGSKEIFKPAAKKCRRTDARVASGEDHDHGMMG